MANYKWAAEESWEEKLGILWQKKDILPELAITKISGSTVVSPECRICVHAPETTIQIAIGFTALAGREYKLVHVKSAIAG